MVTNGVHVYNYEQWKQLPAVKALKRKKIECKTCDGDGDFEGKACAMCDGTGYVAGTEKALENYYHKVVKDELDKLLAWRLEVLGGHK